MSLLRRVIGAVLRRERQRQGLTLREVARAAGVSVPYLSEVERGRKEASSEVLAAVCRALGLYLSDLLEAVRDDLRRVERRGPSAVPGTVGFGGHLPGTRAGSVLPSTRPVSGGTPRPVARLGSDPTLLEVGRFGSALRQVGRLGVGGTRSGSSMFLSGGLRIIVFADRPQAAGDQLIRGALPRPATVTRPRGGALGRARRRRSAALATRLMRTPARQDTRRRPGGDRVVGVSARLSRPARDLARA